MSSDGNDEAVPSISVATIKPLPTQLVRARLSVGLSLDEAAQRLEIAPGVLRHWEDGTTALTLDQVADLGEVYGRGTDYFFRPIETLTTELAFRGTQVSSLDDLDNTARATLVRFEELCRAEALLENAAGLRSGSRIPRLNGAEDPEGAAIQVRHRLGLNDQPIRNLRELLAQEGIRVFVLSIPKTPAREFAGLSWQHPEYGPCILVNGRDKAERRNFTMAHEYAHLLISEGPVACAFMPAIPEERYANQFAAAFLMPRVTVQSEYDGMVGERGTQLEDRQLGRLARVFGVSLEAMSWRLEQVELIPKGSTAQRLEEWLAGPPRYRARRGPKWRNQLGERFVNLAIDAHHSGEVSTSRLASLFGIDIRRTRAALQDGPDRRER